MNKNKLIPKILREHLIIEEYFYILNNFKKNFTKKNTSNLNSCLKSIIIYKVYVVCNH